MADAATFSWGTLAVPVVSGVLTTLTTAVIVFGANWLTRKSIETSNAKALEEMKLQVEASNSVALKAIDNTSENEKRKLAYSLKKEWVKDFTDAFAQFYDVGLQLKLQEQVNNKIVCRDNCHELFEKTQNAIFKIGSLFCMVDDEYEDFGNELMRIKKQYFQCLNDIQSRKKFEAPDVEVLGELFQDVVQNEYVNIRSLYAALLVDNPPNS